MIGTLLAIELGTLGLALIAQRIEESEDERQEGVCMPCQQAEEQRYGDLSRVVSIDPTLLRSEHFARGVVLDIRPRMAFSRGHIQGAVNVPAGELARALEHDELDWIGDEPVIVVCNRGIKSVTAAGLLEDEGLVSAVSLSGGMDEWVSRGYPTVQGHNA